MRNGLLQRRGMISVLCIVFLCAAAAGLTAKGHASRIYSSVSRSGAVAGPDHALQIWQEAGVKGRVLFLFDRSLNADPTGASSLPDERLEPERGNYVYIAFRRNIVRRVVHVIPDASWSEVERNLIGNPFVEELQGTFRLAIEGMPVMIMRIRDIAATDELGLVNINAAAWDDRGMAAILDLLQRQIVTTDLITVAGNLPPGQLAALTSHEHLKP